MNHSKLTLIACLASVSLGMTACGDPQAESAKHDNNTGMPAKQSLSVTADNAAQSSTVADGVEATNHSAADAKSNALDKTDIDSAAQTTEQAQSALSDTYDAASDDAKDLADAAEREATAQVKQACITAKEKMGESIEDC